MKNNLPAILEKGESSSDSIGKRDSTSRQLNFDDPDENCVNKKEPDRPKISLFSKIQSIDATKKSVTQYSSESVTLREPDVSWKPKSTDVKKVDALSAQN